MQRKKALLPATGAPFRLSININFNPESVIVFQANGLSVYPLKTSETFSDVSRWYRNRLMA